MKDRRLFFTTGYYHQTQNLAEILSPDDRVFISPAGTFINRGSIFTCRFEESQQILESIGGENPHDINPFLVFGLSFDSDTNSSANLIAIPQEMVFISPAGWVTHFLISQDASPSVPNSFSTKIPYEYPHHIEISSPESKEQFQDNIGLILKHIETGNASKVVLARQLDVRSDVAIDPRLVLIELVDSQPESYVYSIDGFVGATPELLVEKSSRSIKCQPMAGTRKRHARVNEDDATIADLQTHSKDLNEHNVVVKDIVSKLSKIVTGVSASAVPHVIRLPHVAHLATDITATANSPISLIELVQELHPTPAVAGNPTNEAIEIITDIESFSREMYGAPIGWIDSTGDGESAIALRCAKITGTSARLFAGVGIVSGSDPQSEWEETQAKFGVMRDALVNIAQ